MLLLILAATSAAAIRLLPWGALLALAGGLACAVLVMIKWGLPRLLPRLLEAPFRAKGSVLRGATAQVHSVERAAAPADGTGRAEERTAAEALDYYDVDVTITPRPSAGAFALWEPDELRLAGPDEQPEAPDSAEAAGAICAVEVAQDGGFEPASGTKLEGAQRLRLLLSVPRAQRRVRLRYYFELFGDIALAPPARTALVGASPAPVGRSPFVKAR